ncbi:hypothetical protein HGRIS_000163 [Hohenbuehelia grisea]|uniref:orotate phosphoribosyltransferase n=1 Tax=Hohenbuehelia grisea TaxID=104357 RepID=A0ABR3JQE2_9AGAR
MSLESYQNELIEQSMAVDALKFGTFTLKSGRISPYFINAGLLNTGPILATVSAAYAATIVAALKDSTAAFPEFDVLFGPAYKGIPFAACTALQLHTTHKKPVGFAFDRKEAKDHGEGGNMVGTPVEGKRVVILDDVMTSGKAVRGAIDIVTRAGGEVVGVVQLLDREEFGQDGKSSTVKELERDLGAGRVRSILKLRDLMAWLETKGMQEELQKMRAYRDQYGVNKDDA